jgi:hypothetical protein
MGLDTRLTHQRLGSLGLGWWRGWAVFVLSITFKTEIIFGNLDQRRDE